MIGRFTSFDPLAEKDRRWSSYSYGHNNPISRIDVDGMFDWVKDGNEYKWDDRVVDQKTATQYQGEDAKYIGKAATIYSVGTSYATGERTVLDETKLLSDGSIEGMRPNDHTTITNRAGSDFTQRRTDGAFIGLSANFAFAGGFGIGIGAVTDAMGSTKPYFSFNGNIGFGLGAGLDFGTITPNNPDRQFYKEDFSGKSGSYSGGITTPIGGIGGGYGGSLTPDITSGDAMRPSNFGKGPQGYTVGQASLSGPGKYKLNGSPIFGFMYTNSTTW